jgi:hypothetical protein
VDCPTAVGTRIQLVRTNDPWTRLKRGSLGTITGPTRGERVPVRWDEGSTLGLLLGLDTWRTAPDDSPKEATP